MAAPVHVRHVVLVLVDAMRADRLGAYGGRAGTPAMDALARGGTVFANACAQAPSTRPSVSSLMTGLYPSQHKIFDRVVDDVQGPVTVVGLGASVPMLAEVLSNAGVSTAAFLGGNANLKPVFGLTRGFDHTRWHPTTDGAVLVDDFAAWAATAHPGRTFSYLHFMDVHHPLPTEIIPSRLDHGLDLDTVDQTADELVACYDRAVRLVDQHLGRVLNVLHSAEMWDETLLVVTADHGEELMEHGAMLSHGRTLYRELVRVPLLLHLPRAGAGSVHTAPVQLIDLFPTVLDALGQPALELPGRSLLRDGRGVGATERPSFSELHRRDLYAQSVTTSTEQLVVTYLFDGRTSTRVEDLRPGMWIRAKGEPLRGGPFIATKVGVSADASTKLRGTIERFDHVRGTATMLGVRFAVDADGEYLGLDDTARPLSSLEAGHRVSLTLEYREDAGWVAVRGVERKPGGKSKVEAPIESVGRSGDVLVLRLLGIDVHAPGRADILDKFRDKSLDSRKADGLQRMLDADFVDRRVELFDLSADPAQTTNILDDRPDVAQELEGRLAAWTEWLGSNSTSTAASVEVDPETLDQLRRMGYLE